MQVQVHYQGVDHSRWLDEFLTRKVSKLDRFLAQTSPVHVYLKHDGPLYQTTIEAHGFNRDFAFESNGDNLYESFSTAIDKAVRALSEEKRRLRDKINSRFFSLKRYAI